MGHTNFWHTLNGSKGVSKPSDSVTPSTNDSSMHPAEAPTAEDNDQSMENQSWRQAICTRR